jgi:hypothetical protein
MKKWLLLNLSLLTFFWLAGFCLAAAAPHEVGGFVLNRNIADFKDYVIMETALPIRYMENIEEVEVKSIAGIKSGLIAYATCIEPGHIVRIKLKYADSSKKFYEDLVEKIKEKYGKPNEYRGDPFHVVISWKWSFVDEENNSISMILQHNTMDTEEKKGNSIKLTMSNLIEKDRKCYNMKTLNQREKKRLRNWKVMRPELSGWELFVPR